jgi:predicted RNA-binding protein associated with RNAse of E/G family
MRVPRPISYGYLRPPDNLSTFHGTLLYEDDDYIVLTHTVHPSKPLVRGGQVVLASGSPIVWFLFKNMPYDVGRFHTPAGEVTGVYVDMTEPVCWTGSDADTLSTVVDLFLDVWIPPRGDAIVLDEDELEEAYTSGAITSEQRDRARCSCATVLSGIAGGTFPPGMVSTWPAPTGKCDASS